MTIIRIRHIQTNFTTVSNAVINDTRLSHHALGIWLRLISKHDGWEISAAGVAALYPENGRESVTRGFKELCKYGYMIKIPTPRKGGRYQTPIMELYSECHLDYELTDDQIDYLFSKNEFSLEEIQKIYPKRVFRHGEPETIIPTQQKKDEQNKDKLVCVDSPLVAASPPLRRKKRLEEGIEISKDDIFIAAVQKRKDWSAEEIDMVWEIIMEYENPIRDWVAFCDGTIKNQRKLNKLKHLDRKEDSCNNEYQDLDTKQSNKPFCTPSDSTSTKGTSGLHLANWRQLIKQPQPSLIS